MSGLPLIDSLRSPGASRRRPSGEGRFGWFNPLFALIIAALVGFGLVITFSAVSVNEDYNISRQIGGLAAGIILMLVLWRFDYRRLSNYTTLFLIINVVLILSPHLPVLGQSVKGAQSWINIGIQIQPGEFAKITVILLNASVMARYGGKLDDPREYCRALGIMLVPFLCVMTQPDLGTGLVYLSITAVALVIGGADKRLLLITLGVCVALVVLLFGIDEVIKGATGEYKLIKDYQRGRLLVFMDDSYDPTGEGYNLQQAKIAIGSGGLFGKGLFQGTQHSLGLLPEAPTDYIFCVLAEETGFFGALLLLALYAALIFYSIRVARQSTEAFGMILVMCVVGMWLFQVLENIGMTCGMMPCTGIPLPFVSYGSSFMVTNFVMLGFIGSVQSHGLMSSTL